MADGHTLSVSDIFYIASSLGLFGTHLGLVDHLTETEVVSNDGTSFPAGILCKCVGFQINEGNEQLLGRSHNKVQTPFRHYSASLPKPSIPPPFHPPRLSTPLTVPPPSPFHPPHLSTPHLSSPIIFSTLNTEPNPPPHQLERNLWLVYEPHLDSSLFHNIFVTSGLMNATAYMGQVKRNTLPHGTRAQHTATFPSSSLHFSSPKLCATLPSRTSRTSMETPRHIHASRK